MNPIYRMVLMQPVYERRALGALWITWLLLAGAALIVLVFGLLTGKWRLGVLLGTIVLGAVALMWWGMLVKTAVLQNRPANACLVPRLRQRLMLVLVLSFSAMALLLAALATAQVRHFGYLLAAISLLFPFTLLAQRYTWVAMVPSVLILSMVSWLKEPTVRLVERLAHYDETLLSLLALTMVAGASVRALQLALPAGGDAHADWFLAYSRRLAALQRGVALPHLAAGERHSWWSFWQRWQFGGAAVRLPLRQQLLAGLGISSRGLVFSAPLAVVGGFLGLAITGYGLGLKTSQAGIAMIEAVAMLSVPFTMQALVTAIGQRTGEQALLRLAPGMPAAPDLNRVLGRAALLRFLVVWLSSAHCLLLLDAYDASRLAVSGFGLLLAALPLPLAGWVLRDYAAMPRQPVSLHATVPMMLVVFIAPVGFRLLLPDFWCGVLALVVAVASLVLLRWRWQRMVRAPVAFPAGRLAP